MGCGGGGRPVAERIEPAGRTVFCVKFKKEVTVQVPQPILLDICRGIV